MYILLIPVMYSESDAFLKLWTLPSHEKIANLVLYCIDCIDCIIVLIDFA